MIAGISSNLQALSALAVSQAVTANNVANVNTDGYKSQEARLTTGPDGEGVRVSDIVRDASPGGYQPEAVSAYNQAGVYAPSAGLVEMSNVDLARQAVSMIETTRAFEANAVTIRSQDKMLGNLLDMRV